MNTDESNPITRPIPGFTKKLSWRIRVGLIITFAGFFVFLVGARPALFGWDRSIVVGFIQIAVFLVGLAMISLGGYTCLMSFWRNGSRTIPVDIGMRLVSMGYVIAVFSGMSDVFGMGTQNLPEVPFFGNLQAFGVQFGEAIIAVGFLLMIPYSKFFTRDPSNKNNNETANL